MAILKQDDEFEMCNDEFGQIKIRCTLLPPKNRSAENYNPYKFEWSFSLICLYGISVIQKCNWRSCAVNRFLEPCMKVVRINGWSQQTLYVISDVGL